MTTSPDITIRTSDIVPAGVRLRVSEAGSGPLVLLLHGWPELSYSWRHQLPALAAAGYHAVAPDMRGFGGSDAPSEVDACGVHHLLADSTGLLGHYGTDQAVLVGHDWGAILAWQLALLAPERFRAVVGMSVPYNGRGERSLIELLARTYGDKFQYILYFQQPGVADAEFDANPGGILAPLYAGSGRGAEDVLPAVTDPRMSAGGWIDRLVQPRELPDWLTQDDLDTYVEWFTIQGSQAV